MSENTVTTKIQDANLEIPESVRTMHQSDTAREEHNLSVARKRWGGHFKDIEQLDMFLLLPLNDQQRHDLIKNLQTNKT